jgi:hypothetical protein
MAKKDPFVRFYEGWHHRLTFGLHPETDADYATRLISLDDDPTLPVYTFRMWFLALGLSCFSAVLGQIFVRPLLVLSAAI